SIVLVVERVGRRKRHVSGTGGLIVEPERAVIGDRGDWQIGVAEHIHNVNLERSAAYFNGKRAAAVLAHGHVIVDGQVGSGRQERAIGTCGWNCKGGSRRTLVGEFIGTVGQKLYCRRIVMVVVGKGDAVGVADRLIGRSGFRIAIDIDVLCS